MTTTEDTKTASETEAKLPPAEETKVGETAAIDDEALEDVSGGLTHLNQR